MCQNPALAQALARDRVAELRHAAGPGARNRREVPRARAIHAVRRDAGWLLVDVGLRLALGQRAIERPVARQAGNP